MSKVSPPLLNEEPEAYDVPATSELKSAVVACARTPIVPTSITAINRTFMPCLMHDCVAPVTKGVAAVEPKASAPVTRRGDSLVLGLALNVHLSRKTLWIEPTTAGG